MTCHRREISLYLKLGQIFRDYLKEISLPAVHIVFPPASRCEKGGDGNGPRHVTAVLSSLQKEIKEGPATNEIFTSTRGQTKKPVHWPPMATRPGPRAQGAVMVAATV